MNFGGLIPQLIQQVATISDELTRSFLERILLVRALCVTKSAVETRNEAAETIMFVISSDLPASYLHDPHFKKIRKKWMRTFRGSGTSRENVATSAFIFFQGHYVVLKRLTPRT